MIVGEHSVHGRANTVRWYKVATIRRVWLGEGGLTVYHLLPALEVGRDGPCLSSGIVKTSKEVVLCSGELSCKHVSVD
jgi:hypothetical protein